jgi:hypothetical protein
MKILLFKFILNIPLTAIPLFCGIKKLTVNLNVILTGYVYSDSSLLSVIL